LQLRAAITIPSVAVISCQSTLQASKASWCWCLQLHLHTARCSLGWNQFLGKQTQTCLKLTRIIGIDIAILKIILSGILRLLIAGNAHHLTTSLLFLVISAYRRVFGDLCGWEKSGVDFVMNHLTASVLLAQSD